MKKFIFIVLGTILILFFFSNTFVALFITDEEHSNFNEHLREEKGLLHIGGKDIKTNILLEDERNYSIFLDENDETNLWSKSEREKMVEYMKKNNLKIKPGEYELNQATTFEKALEIFEFEKQ
ncbi:hypothetical protein [Wukongibacter sp. M2B1]|uniref:hypothetical protein n=1 Tax=Wukongibacter sp. M2B1 TaxID=3088895 RepID=UPI003D7949B6